MSTTKVFICAQWQQYSKEWQYGCFAQDMALYGYVLVEERDLEFMSPNDLVLKQQLIALLRNKQQEVRAKAQSDVVELDEQIQNLLALPAPNDDEVVL